MNVVITSQKYLFCFVLFKLFIRFQFMPGLLKDCKFALDKILNFNIAVWLRRVEHMTLQIFVVFLTCMVFLWNLKHFFFFSLRKENCFINLSKR
jgi:hypothetical protein